MSEPRFGIYPGIVVNDNDPERSGRITALVPMVLGAVPCEWAQPCWPPGWSKNLLEDHGGHGSHGGISISNHTHSVDVSSTTSSSETVSTTVDIPATLVKKLDGSAPDPVTEVNPAPVAATSSGHSHTVDPAPVTSSPAGGGSFFNTGGDTHSEHTAHKLLVPVPTPGTNVWIMFIGGDVDKPVWMGVSK